MGNLEDMRRDGKLNEREHREAAHHQHSVEDDFQHYLSYSGLRFSMPDHIDSLRAAFYAGAGETPLT